jgi:hypothetical protein
VKRPGLDVDLTPAADADDEDVGAGLDLLVGMGDVGVRHSIGNDTHFPWAGGSAQAGYDNTYEANQVGAGGHRGCAWTREEKMDVGMARLLRADQTSRRTAGARAPVCPKRYADQRPVQAVWTVDRETGHGQCLRLSTCGRRSRTAGAQRVAGGLAM